MIDRIALVDLDATLADYSGAIKRDLKLIAAPNEDLSILEDDNHKEVPYIKSRIKMIRSQPGWWISLEPLKSGFAVVELLKKHGFLIHVLTKAPNSVDAAWSEKVIWSKKYLPEADITITPHKGMVYGRVIFDDHPDHIIPWLKHRPRGLVIMTDQPWNKELTHPQVVRYTGDNLDEVEDRIRAVIQVDG
jgi:hypothetical protein